MQPQIMAAEREAQFFSAFARLIVVSIAITIFLIAGGTRLPVAPVVLTYLVSYGTISVISAVFSMKRFFRPWLSLIFTAVDGVSLALLIGFALTVTGSSMSLHAAVPGYIFFFSILILATMRYTVGPTIVACISFSATLWLFSAFATGDAEMSKASVAASVDPAFFFGPVQNAARWGFVGIATILSVLAVFRRRKTLEAAISSTIKTANLSRYFPKRIASLAAEQGIEALSAGRQQNAAVVFVDVRAFTGMSETMSPAELSNFLSDFRSMVSNDVDRHGGFVEKFIGDAVMVVFGVPDETTGCEARAVEFARAILHSVATWNQRRSDGAASALAVTVGAHAGVVFAGAVGAHDRMEFTVLGDAVNIAARLQEIAKATDTGLVVSRDLLVRSGALANRPHEWKELAGGKIRGRIGEVAALEYVGFS
ncbi:hypothetical protein GV827_19675 [Sulfitobacter sp. JBTF-M27]|uniref:Guanylate cyclase domain-containing protein n=1 Tax=Sulfitobacter sediminilitoris TaxID=2698830 RepID=A0A6P0CJH8_9RHOB|nr:adenylate/guanylate cyclase domain-containing protein [Sulfitobacter sediminilitoris]NEK24604.1 hypothetical protein [Sulfitobacter sediminilitoris]